MSEVPPPEHENVSEKKIDPVFGKIRNLSGLLQGGAQFEDALSRSKLSPENPEELLDILAVTSDSRIASRDTFSKAWALVPQNLRTDRRFLEAIPLGAKVGEIEGAENFNYFRTERQNREQEASPEEGES